MVSRINFFDEAAKARESGSLVEAVDTGNIELIENMIDSGARVNDKKDGYAALHAAAQFGYTKLVEVLIENGADVNIEDKDGYTPLMHAAAKGNAAIVSRLLDMGAQDKEGRKSAQSIAGLMGHKALAQALEKYADQKKILDAMAELKAAIQQTHEEASSAIKVGKSLFKTLPENSKN